jgi:hypothetical protein
VIVPSPMRSTCLADFKVEEYYLLPSTSAENDCSMSAKDRFLNGSMVEFKSPGSVVLPNEDNIEKLQITLEKGYALSDGKAFSNGTYEFQKSAVVFFYQGCKAQLLVKYI